MKTIETERLLLRDWRESDAGEYFKLCHDPDIENAGWKICESPGEALERIRSNISCQESWAVALKNTDNLIGAIFLSDINRHKGYKEIEYAISKDYRNRGYAAEAVKHVLRHAFTELDLLVVAACCYPYNKRSMRVIEKCGFTYEGTLRKYSRNLYDSVRYSMTKEDWESGSTL